VQRFLCRMTSLQRTMTFILSSLPCLAEYLNNMLFMKLDSTIPNISTMKKKLILQMIWKCSLESTSISWEKGKSRIRTRLSHTTNNWSSTTRFTPKLFLNLLRMPRPLWSSFTTCPSTRSCRIWRMKSTLSTGDSAKWATNLKCINTMWTVTNGN